MNELIARTLADRFAAQQDVGLLTHVAGLVKTMESDALANGNTETYPVPYSMNTRDAEDWKFLLPDSEKTAITYFEDGGSSRPQVIGGFHLIKSRLTLVCWFNGGRIINASREQMGNHLLVALIGKSRSVPSTDPAIANMKIESYSVSTADPFTKYSSYNNLFQFKNAPYGWLALDLSVTAYINLTCLVES